MPAPTPETLQNKVQALKKSIEEKGEGMEPRERRLAKKRLRRAQRKQHRLATEVTRQAGMSKKKQEAAAEPTGS